MQCSSAIFGELFQKPYRQQGPVRPDKAFFGPDGPFFVPDGPFFVPKGLILVNSRGFETLVNSCRIYF